MDERSLAGLLNALDVSPWKRETWLEIANGFQEQEKNEFLSFLKTHAHVASFFITLLESDPDLTGVFLLTLEDIDALQQELDNDDIEDRGATGDDLATGSESVGLLDELDSDLADLLGTGEPPRGKQDGAPRPGTAVAPGAGATGDIDAAYRDLIRKASSKAFSFTEKDLTEAVDTYLQAFKLKEGTANDWYGLAQAYLKRAQRVAGVFTYSFEGNYKDVSDFYSAMEAAKRAVSLDPGDPILWQNLSSVFEIMNKKAVALHCAKKAVSIYQDQQERLSTSELLGPSSFTNDQGIEMMRTKVNALARDATEEIDPFNDDAMERFENAVRKQKLSRNVPLDHLELYMEAIDQYKHGELEATKKYLRKAIDLKNDFFEAWILLARLLSDSARVNEDTELQRIEFSDATRCIERAKEIDPASIEPYKILADQYAFLDARDDYIRALAKINELEPDNWEYKKLLSEVYLEKGLHFHVYGDLLQAQSFLEKATSLYQYNATAWKWLGMNDLLRGELEDALAALEESQRLDENVPGIDTALVEIFMTKARVHLERGELDAGLSWIDRALATKPGLDVARSMKQAVIEDLCESGFDALDGGGMDDAPAAFSKALEIDPAAPFAMLGKAFIRVHEGRVAEAVDLAGRALHALNENPIANATEFTLALAFKLTTSLLTRDGVPREGIETLAKEFKTMLITYLRGTRVVKQGELLHGEAVIGTLSYYFEPARLASNGNQNALLFLEGMDAGTLREHVDLIDARSPDGSGGADEVPPARRGILEALHDPLEAITGAFLERSAPGKEADVIAFLTFLTERAGFTMQEVFYASSFLESGAMLLKHVDILASNTHVASITVDATSIGIEKTPWAVFAIKPHPSLDVVASIAKDLRIHFSKRDWTSLESAIFTGKAIKFHAADFQWSPDGLFAIACENKEQKRSFKSLVQGVTNRVMLLDLRHDPMINPTVDTFSLDPAMLESTIHVEDVAQNTAVLAWKDAGTFQAVLKDGTILRWTGAGENLSKRASKVPVSETTLIAGARNQKAMAIYSKADKSLLHVNITTDEVFKFHVEGPWTVECITWDNASRNVHALVTTTGGERIACTAASDGTFSEVASFGIVSPHEDGFHVVQAGDHVFYFLLDETSSILTLVEDSKSIKINFRVEPGVKSMLEKGILSMEVQDAGGARFFLEQGDIASITLGHAIKEVLEERIAFLQRFPRHTFHERSAHLASMRAAVP